MFENVRSLKDVRYWDGWLGGMAHIMQTVADCMDAWSQMPAYARAEKLVYLGQLRQHVDHVRGGIERGKLTRRQVEQFRKLEAKVGDAFGLITVLHEKHEAMEREGEAP